MKRATILFTALWLTLGAAAAGNPKADPRAVVEAGNARFTVLTPQLIRMEWSEDGLYIPQKTTKLPAGYVVFNFVVSSCRIISKTKYF